MWAGTNTKSQGRDNAINHMNKSASWPLGSTNKLNLTCPLALFFCMPLTLFHFYLFIFSCLCYPCSLFLPFSLSFSIVFIFVPLLNSTQHTYSVQCLALLWIHQSWGSCVFGRPPCEVGWSLSRFQLKLVMQTSCVCVWLNSDDVMLAEVNKKIKKSI